MRVLRFAAISAAVAAASGGIALAAAHSTGRPSTAGRVLRTTAAAQAQQQSAPGPAAHLSRGRAARAGAGKSPHDTPGPNLTGLCHAWLAGAGSRHGNARRSPAFLALISAAGGSGSVPDYCARLVGAASHPGREPKDTEEESPADPSDPLAHPVAFPSDRPATGRSGEPAGASDGQTVAF